jgi:cytochrome c peroxidase
MARRTPPTVNLAFSDTFLWDGRSDNLDTQATGPMSNPGIMNLPAAKMVQRLGGIAGYRTLFAAAFPGEAISPATMARAIAAFERSVVSAPAPFDAWVAGDETAIPDSAKRGFGLFVGKANCVKCHEGWNFTNGSFHDIGLPDTSDPGRGQQVPNVIKLQYAFKTPTLRDVAIRPPYMHDGSMRTLPEVNEFYVTGGTVRPSKSLESKPLSLSAEEKRDLLEFLLTLTGRPEPFVVPALPR